MFYIQATSWRLSQSYHSAFGTRSTWGGMWVFLSKCHAVMEALWSFRRPGSKGIYAMLNCIDVRTTMASTIYFTQIQLSSRRGWVSWKSLGVFSEYRNIRFNLVGYSKVDVFFCYSVMALVVSWAINGVFWAWVWLIMANKNYSPTIFWVKQFGVAAILIIGAAFLIHFQNADTGPEERETDTKNINRG